MKITISARKTTARDSFKERVEHKLAKLDRFFNDETEAIVTVTNEGERETVEVTIQSAGFFYRAEKTTPDRLDSLEAVVDSLFKQIIKNKEKLSARLKDSAFACAVDEEDTYPPTEYQIVKTKRFPVKPMDMEEALLQMNMLGHSFFMFRNGDTDEINVVYKRKNGSYGLIEPQDTDDED